MFEVPGASPPLDDTSDGDLSAVPLPSSTFLPSHSSTQTSLHPVIGDDKVISRLLESVLWKAGITQKEAADRLGINPATIRQYIGARRTRPSVQWFVKFVESCGGRVFLQFPSRADHRE